MKQAVVGLVIKDNKVLIGKKVVLDNHPLSGCWHIPGGHIKKGEDTIQALKRELKEETNIDVEITNELGFYISKDTQTFWYLCETYSTKLKAGDDLADVKFVDKKLALKLCDKKGISFWPSKVLEYFKN